ncbi:hypothetical protein CE91St41_12880 [Oscillospiraceae bacterium]|nr:hypothetical protein CE91St40_24660 [Oscillospiraceae bacterium]BDF74399.1 hypothetical protein CE91St41_12880 [Oscillospiraceae bacterium]
MNDLLYDIYNREMEDRSLRFDTIPLYKSKYAALERCHNKIRETMGLEALDALNNAEADVATLEELACFRHGFRLAFRLLGEALSGRV